MRRLLLALALLVSPAVAQTTWYVDGAGTPPGTGTQADPYTSIQYAIAQASTLPGDTVLVQPGTYQERLDFLGKAIHVKSAAGSAVTSLDNGTIGGDLVTFASGEGPSAILEGLSLVRTGFAVQGRGVLASHASPTIRNCVIRNQRPNADEGAMRLENSNTLIEGCTFQDNQGSIGAGLYAVDSCLTVLDCTFVNNEANIGSGIAAYDSDIDLFRCTFMSNGSDGACPFGGLGAAAHFNRGTVLLVDCIMESGVAGRGGALSLQSSQADLVRCEIRSNCAGCGGGIEALGSVVQLNNCLVEDNIASFGIGGGLSLYSSDVTILDSVLARNLAGGDDHDAGGILQGGGTLVIERTRFEENACTQRGGAIHSAGDLVVRDSIFAGNKAILCTSNFAHQGGAVWTSGTAQLERCLLVGNSLVNPFGGGGSGTTVDAGGAVYGPAVLINCVLWDNSSYDVSGGVHDAVLLNSVAWSNTVLLPGGGTAPSNLGGTATATYSNIEGSWPGVGNIDQPPRFWGPPIEDFHLLPGSPCIDAGDPASPLDPDGSRADMGIYPFDPNYCGSPFNYCTGKTNSLGCIPFLSTNGFPSATSTGPFEIIGNDMVPSEAGFMVYGFNRNQLGFHGGTLCVKAPVARVLPPQHSKATGTPPCTGRLLFGFNKRIQSGVDVLLVPGQTVFVQLRQRDPNDPAGFGDSLTDAVQFTICP